MLTAIKRIKNLGVFGDYSHAPELKDFARYNLIYGENGSGKTTLSRLFSALNDGSHPEYPQLEFSVDAEGGTLTKGLKAKHKLRVFNSDFVDANIGKFDGPLRPILIVGLENKALAEEVRQEQAICDARTLRIEEISKAVAKAEADRGKAFSGVAKTIGEATSGASLRSYRKPDAEKDFARLKPLKSFPEQELEVHRATLRQEQADPVAEFALPLLEREGRDTPISFSEACAELSNQVATLMQRTAQEGTLKRLIENPDLSKWVEAGIKLHHDHSSQACEYCAQPIPPTRVEALAQHFGAADQLLKTDIEAAMEMGRSLAASLRDLRPSPKQSLYKELWKEYDVESEAFDRARNDCLKEIAELEVALENKLVQRSVPLTTTASLHTDSLTTTAGQLNGLIQRHNEKTGQFSKTKLAARETIERHYLAGIEKQVGGYDRQIDELKVEAGKLQSGAPDLPDARSMDALSASINEKRAKVSSAHAGGAEMTERLRSFLGRTDLEFQSNDEGYRVLRRGKAAKRLSEGEKTAIAFLYFVVQLGDHEFNVADGIVVIDDPISSLDSAAIYQAFALLKNAVKDAKQVFLLTHNFEFLKLLLDWLRKARKASQFYMIVCSETETERVATIVPLDQMLIDHPTEYHFLFKTLYTFKSDGQIATCYHIPNIARKLLETFLEFHAPSSDSMYQQLEAIKFDESKKTAIYKFTNDHSHRTGKGFDPAIVAESQKNVHYLLEMIHAVAPTHYEGLEKLCA